MPVAAKNKSHSTLKQALVILFLKLTGMLPLALSRRLGGLIGLLGVKCSNQAYRVTRRNLELCFPAMDDSARATLARESMQETGKLMLETGAVWMRDTRWVLQKIHAVHHLEILEDALASKAGVILLAPHLGNWEALGLYVVQKTPMMCLYQPPNMPALESLIRRARGKAGTKLVPTNRRGVVALLKALKSGELTGILPDQVPDSQAGGEFAPFFGVPALTMTLVTNLRQSTSCRIIAGVAVRVDGGFEIHFIDAAEGIYSSDPVAALTALNQTVERCVAISPAQYQWEYKRFRKQPDKSNNPYKN